MVSATGGERAPVSRSCEHCGRPFVVPGSVGRPRKYCRRSCRQRAFEARRHAGDLEWSDARLTRLAADLAALEDQLDAVRHAVLELRGDLVDERDPGTEVALARIDAALQGTQ